MCCLVLPHSRRSVRQGGSPSRCAHQSQEQQLGSEGALRPAALCLPSVYLVIFC